MKNNNRRLGKSVGAPPAAEERLRSGCLSPTSYRRSPKSTLSTPLSIDTEHDHARRSRTDSVVDRSWIVERLFERGIEFLLSTEGRGRTAASAVSM